MPDSESESDTMTEMKSPSVQIPRFSGKSSEAENWWSIFSSCQSVYKWDINTSLLYMQLNFSQSANQWLSNLDGTEKKDIKVLETAFKSYFVTGSSVIFLEANFNKLTPMQGETYDDYFLRLKTEGKKIEASSQRINSQFIQSVDNGCRSFLLAGDITSEKAILEKARLYQSMSKKPVPQVNANINDDHVFHVPHEQYYTPSFSSDYCDSSNQYMYPNSPSAQQCSMQFDGNEHTKGYTDSVHTMQNNYVPPFHTDNVHVLQNSYVPRFRGNGRFQTQRGSFRGRFNTSSYAPRQYTPPQQSYSPRVMSNPYRPQKGTMFAPGYNSGGRHMNPRGTQGGPYRPRNFPSNFQNQRPPAPRPQNRQRFQGSRQGGAPPQSSSFGNGNPKQPVKCKACHGPHDIKQCRYDPKLGAPRCFVCGLCSHMAKFCPFK